jgi:hypothetical protein
MQEASSEDRASRAGLVIGTILALGVLGVIAIDFVNAVAHLLSA